MTYSTAELADSSTPFWFCLKAQPKREHLAASGLRQQLQIACFSPRLRFRKMTSRGAVWFVEAMFPGYLFAEFIYAELRRRVEHAPGIRSIVHFGDYLPIVDLPAIERLREAGGDDEIVTLAPEIRIGEPVKIAEGPFQGIEALVTNLLPAKERVRVLFKFLGRPLEADFPLRNVLSTPTGRV